jgi:hypothetical protein
MNVKLKDKEICGIWCSRKLQTTIVQHIQVYFITVQNEYQLYR